MKKNWPPLFIADHGDYWAVTEVAQQLPDGIKYVPDSLVAEARRAGRAEGARMLANHLEDTGNLRENDVAGAWEFVHTLDAKASEVEQAFAENGGE